MPRQLLLRTVKGMGATGKARWDVPWRWPSWCNVIPRVLNVEVLLLDLGFWIVSETEMAGSAVKDT